MFLEDPVHPKPGTVLRASKVGMFLYTNKLDCDEKDKFLEIHHMRLIRRFGAGESKMFVALT